MFSGPKRLKVSFTGAVKKKWNSSDGIYILSTSLVNGKPYWLQENGSDAIWYDKNGHWNVGLESKLGQSEAKAISSLSQNSLPHELAPWKYYVNSAWTFSDDICVTSLDESKFHLFSNP